MAWDLTVELEDRPGMLAELGSAIGSAGLNLGGACAVVDGGVGTIHLLVEGELSAAKGAVESIGEQVAAEREVLVVDVRDQPGTLGSYAKKLADAGVNIELMYVATATRLVFGVDDLMAGRSALGMPAD